MYRKQAQKCQFSLKMERSRNGSVPFFVPEIFTIRSCLVPFPILDIRSCLVPQKKERVPERVPFETRSLMLCQTRKTGFEK